VEKAELTVCESPLILVLCTIWGNEIVGS